jgi:UDP-N-acetylglucosamine 1-carboxyvinyltransferase
LKLQIDNTDKIIGTINISGSKNASLPMLAVSILTKEEIILHNVPNILDIEYMINLLRSIGVKVSFNKETNILIMKKRKLKANIKSEYLDKIRASYYLMGSLFSKKRKIKTNFPGGCNFEKRPIDYHLDAFRTMGAKVYSKNNQIIIKRNKKLCSSIKLPTKSVGATINILLASVLTNGITEIINPSLEPEVKELINLLNQMGGSIAINKDNIIITGVKKLHGITYKVMPDRIEAGSYLFLAASAKQSNVLINNINVNHLKEVIKMITLSGVDILIKENSIRVLKNSTIKNMNIVADNYPAFPTDLQQIATAALLCANSTSTVKDNIYKNRFTEVNELLKMNANIEKEDNKIIIYPSTLIGATVYAQDLRAGFSLIVAAVNANSYTTIENAEVIFRGYEHLIEKLKNININAKIIK